jgi:hypothetical protein
MRMNWKSTPLFLAFLAAVTAGAHPIPDLPVSATFEDGGKATIKVVVDPRVSAEDPVKQPSLLNEALMKMSEEEKAVLVENAKAYAAEALDFYFLPLGEVTPAFEWQITSETDEPLTKPDQPVAVTGIWNTTVPAGMGGYQIRADESCKVGVYFHNNLRGQPLKLNVLFPGEKSYVVDLSGLTGATATGVKEAVNERSTGGWLSTFTDFIYQGFIHVVPQGLDHILFVLGLFLLSRELRPLLLQVTTFTVAHTITLWLAMEGWVKVSGSVVEPIIAGSIAVVALENVYHSRYTHWRLFIVFAFGLIHGLGFASVLSDLDLGATSLLAGLLGFNVGVELGQLAVISAALAVTFWIKDPAIYRRWVVIPASLAIAAAGLYWMVERIWGA